MRNWIRTSSLLALCLAIAGCAGGWRNGPPADAAGTAGTAAATRAPAAPVASPSNAEGATFTWKGDGQSVHLAGEFNDWSTSADPLAKQDDGSWTITKKLAPGRYAYKFVIDGGTWKEDPNASETVDDGFGGKNALIVVGGGGGGGATPAVTPGSPAKAAATASGGASAGKAPEVTPDGVRFFFPGKARTVHLAGDFNGWSTTTDAMTVGADGMWTLVKKLEPGTYAYKFVVDGTTWKHDDANPESTDDGFGGTNSLITVP